MKLAYTTPVLVMTMPHEGGRSRTTYETVGNQAHNVILRRLPEHPRGTMNGTWVLRSLILPCDDNPGDLHIRQTHFLAPSRQPNVPDSSAPRCFSQYFEFKYQTSFPTLFHASLPSHRRRTFYVACTACGSDIRQVYAFWLDSGRNSATGTGARDTRIGRWWRNIIISARMVKHQILLQSRHGW